MVLPEFHVNRLKTTGRNRNNIPFFVITSINPENLSFSITNTLSFLISLSSR